MLNGKRPFRFDCDTINSKEDESRNTFVELALNYSFAMLARLVPAETLTKTLESGLEIVIAGNNDFYSQRKEVTNHIFEEWRVLIVRAQKLWTDIFPKGYIT